MEFNELQQKIIQANENKMIVVASAASGKTATMIGKIIHLLQKGVAPEKILIFSFTNLAAQEIRNRIEQYEEAKGIYIGTLHSYAVSLCESEGIPVQDLIIAEDFDSIIKRSLYIPLERYEEVEWVFVDEAQDLSIMEFEFVSRLNTKHLCYIGDPKQEIYMFKNGCKRVFKKMCEEIGNGYAKYFLNINYRNPQKIMDFAEQFAEYSKVGYRKSECAVDYRGFVWDQEFSFEDCVSDIKENEYGQWAILVRSNQQLEDMKRYLTFLKIPYVTFKRSELTYEELERVTKENSVKLLTCHAMKGSEINYVIASGFRTNSAEEKNISYVAATRAKKELFWLPKIKLPKKVLKAIPAEEAGTISYSKESGVIEF